jgi:hypothetical protein
MISTVRRCLAVRAPLIIDRCSENFTNRPISIYSQSSDKFQALRDIRPACAQLRVAAEMYRYKLLRLNGAILTHHASELRALQAQATACDRLVFDEWNRLSQLISVLDTPASATNPSERGGCRSSDCAEDMEDV